MNEQPCGKCRHFDKRGPARGGSSAFGWCDVKSVYPAKEGPGQVFPAGVARMEDAFQPAKPVIVYPARVVPHCVQFDQIVQIAKPAKGPKK